MCAGLWVDGSIITTASCKRKDGVPLLAVLNPSPNEASKPAILVREDEAQMPQILGSLLRLPVSENITPYLKVTGNANSADTGRLASIAPNFWK